MWPVLCCCLPAGANVQYCPLAAPWNPDYPEPRRAQYTSEKFAPIHPRTQKYQLSGQNAGILPLPGWLCNVPPVCFVRSGSHTNRQNPLSTRSNIQCILPGTAGSALYPANNRYHWQYHRTPAKVQEMIASPPVHTGQSTTESDLPATDRTALRHSETLCDLHLPFPRPLLRSFLLETHSTGQSFR